MEELFALIRKNYPNVNITILKDRANSNHFRINFTHNKDELPLWDFFYRDKLPTLSFVMESIDNKIGAYYAKR